MERLSKQLAEMGLSEEEAAVYVATLELGSTTVLRISRKTGLNRSTLYPVVDSLIQKQLLSQSRKGKRNVLVAESPEKILQLLKQKISSFDALLPELLSLVGHGQVKPKIHYLEGIDGIKRVFLDAAQAKNKELFAFVGIDHLTMRSKALLTFWETTFLKTRLKNQVLGRLILPDTPSGKSYKAKDRSELRESRLVPSSTYNFEGEILVFDDTVCFISYSHREEFALTLESKAIAATVKMIWRIVWNAGY